MLALLAASAAAADPAPAGKTPAPGEAVFNPFRPLGSKRPVLPTLPAARPVQRLALLQPGGAAGQTGKAAPPARQAAPSARQAAPRGSRPTAPAAPLAPAKAPAPAAAALAAAEEDEEALPPPECTLDTACQRGYFCSERLGRCVERKTAINALGLFYLSPDRSLFQILGVFWHARGRRNLNVFAPFYWRFWTAKTSTLVVPPFFATRATPSTRTTWVLPLTFYRRVSRPAAGIDQSTLVTLTPPFVYTRRGDNRFGIGLPGFILLGDRAGTTGLWLFPPIYYGKVAPEPAVARPGARGQAPPGRWGWKLGVAPLLFAKKTDPRSYGIFFPLYWHFARPEATTATLFPLAWYARRKPATTFVLIPFAVHRENHETGARTTVALPFVFRRDNPRERWSHLIFGPYYQGRERGRGLDVFFPLVWRYHDRDAERDTWVVPPYVHHRDARQRVHLFPPLFGHMRDAQARHSLTFVLPFFTNLRRDTFRRTSVLLYYREWGTLHGERISGGGLFPLIFCRRHGDHGRATVFPLIWHWADHGKGTATTLGFPLLYYFRRPGRTTTVFFPLYAGGTRGQTSFRFLFPLFGWLNDREKGTRIGAVGPIYAGGGPTGFAAGIFPNVHFARLGPKRRAIVFPALWYNADVERGRFDFQLLNYFHRGRHLHDPDRVERDAVFFPLTYYRRRGPGARFFSPLLYVDTSPGRRTFITPLGGRQIDVARERERTVVLTGFSFRHRTSHTFGVFPFFVHRTSPGRRTTVTLPLTVWHRDGRSSAQVLFPFFWRFQEPGETITAALPFYYRARRHLSHGRSVDVAFPFYWRYRGPEPGRRTDVILLAFRHVRPDGHAFGLPPILWSFSSPKRRVVLGLPFFFHLGRPDKGTSYTVVPPLYLQTGEESYRAFLPPVLWAGRRKAESYQVLFPWLWRFADREEGKDTVVAIPFLWRKHKEQHTAALLPVAYAHWGGGQRGAGLLPLLYYRSHDGEVRDGKRVNSSSRFWTLPLYRHVKTNDKGERTSNGYVFPYIWASNPDRRLDAVFPVFWRWRERATGRALDLYLPLAFRYQAPAESGFGVFPLFWNIRGIERRGTVFFPLFADFNHYSESRTTVFLPLFLRHHDRYERSTSWVFPPALYVKTRTDGNVALLPPVLWHWKNPSSALTIAFPLYWDFKRPDKRFTVVPPLFYHRRDGKESTTAVFPLVWYLRGEKVVEVRRGTAKKKVSIPYKRLYIVPLVTVWKEGQQTRGWEVLFGLFGYERIGKSRFLKIFFVETALGNK